MQEILTNKVSVNNASSWYIKCARQHQFFEKEINNFRFSFYTNGGFQHKDIAVDLLPHGFSILTELLGYGEIENFVSNVQVKRFKCDFSFKGCGVSFDFIQDPEIEKKFEFEVNGKLFRRIQKGDYRSYKVLLGETSTGRTIELEDPFESEIGRFMANVNCLDESSADEIQNAIAVLEMIGLCVLEY